MPRRDKILHMAPQELGRPDEWSLRTNGEPFDCVALIGHWDNLDLPDELRAAHFRDSLNDPAPSNRRLGQRPSD